MYAGKLVFAQVMEFAPWHTFRRLVAKYRGDFNVRTFSCLDQFLSMAFAQVTLQGEPEGRRGVFRSARHQSCITSDCAATSRACNLADANEAVRLANLYCDFAQALIRIARKLYATEPLGLELEQTVYALESDHHRFASVPVSLGAPFVPPRQQSSCTRSWICEALDPNDDRNFRRKTGPMSACPRFG